MAGLNELCAMFADLSREVVESILQLHNNDSAAAVETLLELQNEAAKVREQSAAPPAGPAGPGSEPCVSKGCRSAGVYVCPLCNQAGLKTVRVCSQAHFDRFWSTEHGDFHKQQEISNFSKLNPAPQPVPGVQFSGYLLKLAQHSVVGKKAKRRRWFVLKNNILQYYVDNQSLHDPVKGLRLDMSNVLTHVPNRSELCFTLSITTLQPRDENREIVMYASSEADLDQWISKIKEASTYTERKRRTDRDLQQRRIDEAALAARPIGPAPKIVVPKGQVAPADSPSVAASASAGKSSPKPQPVNFLPDDLLATLDFSSPPPQTAQLAAQPAQSAPVSAAAGGPSGGNPDFDSTDPFGSDPFANFNQSSFAQLKPVSSSSSSSSSSIPPVPATAPARDSLWDSFNAAPAAPQPLATAPAAAPADTGDWWSAAEPGAAPAPAVSFGFENGGGAVVPSATDAAFVDPFAQPVFDPFTYQGPAATAPVPATSVQDPFGMPSAMDAQDPFAMPMSAPVGAQYSAQLPSYTQASSPPPVPAKAVAAPAPAPTSSLFSDLALDFNTELHTSAGASANSEMPQAHARPHSPASPALPAKDTKRPNLNSSPPAGAPANSWLNPAEPGSGTANNDPGSFADVTW